MQLRSIPFKGHFDPLDGLAIFRCLVMRDHVVLQHQLPRELLALAPKREIIVLPFLIHVVDCARVAEQEVTSGNGNLFDAALYIFQRVDRLAAVPTQ